MFGTQIIDPVTYHDWDQMLLSMEHYSFFHSSCWAKVLSESYNYRPLYFTFFERSRIAGIIPLMEIRTLLSPVRAISLPFSDFCETLIVNGSQFRFLLNEVLNYGRERKWKFLELKGGGRYLENTPPSSQYYRHILLLSSEEKKIFAKFRKGTKSSIKKAEKNDVEVKFSTSLKSMREFYYLHCKTRKKHGVPPQPIIFFKKIYEHVISKNFGVIALASYRDKSIAGGVFFHFGAKAIYKYGASDTDYQQLSANNLILWRVIESYRQNGYEELCFGRTDIQNEGLRRFKRGWNTQESIVDYYKYSFSREMFFSDNKKIVPRHSMVLSYFPITLLRIGGTLLYKHMA